MGLEKTYSEKEASTILKLSIMTLKRHRKSKSISFYKCGRRITYGEHHLEEFLESNEQKKEMKIDELKG